jgi:hypothetical protein
MKMLVVGLSVLAISGCSETLMPNSRAISAVAPAMHESPHDVRILERRDSFPNTILIVQGKHVGRRECWINGGHLANFGLYNTPVCRKEP